MNAYTVSGLGSTPGIRKSDPASNNRVDCCSMLCDEKFEQVNLIAPPYPHSRHARKNLICGGGQKFG